MHLLVTGAAGFIGSHLCEALLKLEHQVTGLDNFNEFYSPAFKEANVKAVKKTAKSMKTTFTCVRGDILEAAAVAEILKEKKIDAIIHLAAMAGVRPSIKNPLLYEQVNGLGTLTLLEAAREAGVKKFVFGSSSSVYGLNKKVPFSEKDPVEKPYSPYAQTKRAGELACHVYHRLYGMSVVMLRFFTVYGPRQRPDLSIRKFTDLIYQNKTIPVYGDGSFKRDFTYIDDIIDGIVKSLEWLEHKSKTPQYEIFNLGESATTSVNALIALLENATGKKAKVTHHATEPGDVPITFADVTKARQFLGYHPQTPIEQGIPRFVEWYRENILSSRP